jgi:hypothetical protein
MVQDCWAELVVLPMEFAMESKMIRIHYTHTDMVRVTFILGDVETLPYSRFFAEEALKLGAVQGYPRDVNGKESSELEWLPGTSERKLDASKEELLRQLIDYVRTN